MEKWTYKINIVYFQGEDILILMQKNSLKVTLSKVSVQDQASEQVSKEYLVSHFYWKINSVYEGIDLIHYTYRNIYLNLF